MSHLDPQTPPPRARRRFPWPIILGLLALVTVPLVVWEWPREMVRWKVARAVQLRENGDKDAAYTAIDEVIEDDPENISVLLVRASWQMEDEQGDRALADVQKALEIDPKDIQLLLMRSQVYMAMHKYANAAQDADAVLEKIPTNRHEARSIILNQAAYSRGVGNIELEVALAQVTEALKLRDEMAYYDTRGYILWRLNRHAEALTDMDLAINRLEVEAKELAKKSLTEGQKKEQDRNTAVIYYHRGLVYQALEKEKEAEEDFARVRQLGEEPGDDLY